MANDAQEWETLKTAYFRLTGEKKPKEAFLKVFSTSHTKLSGSLKAVDKALNTTARNAKDDAEKLKNARIAVAEFKVSSAEYLKLLEKLIIEEKKSTIKPEGREGEANMKKTTARYKGMKMLKTKLEEYQAQFQIQIATFETAGKGWDVIQRTEHTLKVVLQKAFKTAATISAAIKANPTVETWNATMGSDSAGIRSLTTALKAFKQLDDTCREQHKPVPDYVTKDLERANHWIATLAPWANGDKRTLKVDANPKPDILAELKLAMTQVKLCMEAFRNYLT